MKRPAVASFPLFLLILHTNLCFARTWTEGEHYVSVSPAQPTRVAPGKVEVLEVFSYASFLSAAYQSSLQKLKASLPRNTQFVHLPASFKNDQDWPMFQRAFFAAQILGVAEKAHRDMFDAVWVTGELQLFDLNNWRFKQPLPSIADAALVYSKTTGIDRDIFLAVANSPQVNALMKAADSQIAASRAITTPTIIVGGKYRVLTDAVEDEQQLIQLVEYLVAKETGK